jgi:3-oxoacyl-[acyl-carrier protein] reductase
MVLEPDDRLGEIYVGYSDSISRTITAKDVDAFARLSGDYNQLHVDEEFAAKTEFEQRVVHGFLHASMLSTLVGMKIPGRGALYLSQTIDFTRPVFIGDTVVATGIVEKINPASRVIEINMQITNQHKETVLKGMASVKVLRLVNEKNPQARRETTSMGDILTGKVALVTGASRGIGREIARTLAAHGAHVWINYLRSKGAAKDLATMIAKAGGNCTVVQADVSDDTQVTGLLQGMKQLDILVNNAGPKIKSAPFASLDWEDMCLMHEQVVGSAFKVTRASLPLLRESRGKVVNVLTSAALGRTAHNWLPYVAAKSALLGMSKNLAQELGPSGINVNMVSPSMVDTDLTASIPDKIRQIMISQTPMRRLATTEDVANAVLFLASPYSDFISGDNLLVTGGNTML